MRDDELEAEPPDASVPDSRLRQAPLKGRGTATRILHRFESTRREAVEVPPSLDGLFREGRAACTSQGEDNGDDRDDNGDDVPAPETEVTAEHARSILSRNDSPDIPFTWSINPYRGCEHGCIYCYARPTHSYLNLSPGLDFETKLIAKVNAASLLRRELARPGYEPSPINLGAATDPYQPIERSWRLTRGVLEVLDTCQHPFTIVTKSSCVERDLDILVAAAGRRQTYVMISITTLDSALSRKLEPRAAAPQRRLQTVRRLAEAGVPVGVNVAPIIPFLNEPEIEQIVAAAAQAGARSVHYTVLRLPWEVKPLFEEWLSHHVPDRAARIMARVRELRGGKDYDADFRLRMKGEGVWADLIAQRVHKAAARHGLVRRAVELDVACFDRTALHHEAGPQGTLF
jgi:DNA repair photolyase